MENLGKGHCGFPITSLCGKGIRAGHECNEKRSFQGSRKNLCSNKGPAYCLNFCDGTQVLKTTTP